ncbi:13235_t:CDS:2, partial [Funneliformis mosseae]
SGKVSLPSLIDPSLYLLELFTFSSSDVINFQKNIRAYNSFLACSSFSANINESFQDQRPLLLSKDQKSDFVQFYIYDTDHKNSNKLHIMYNINAKILQSLQIILN